MARLKERQDTYYTTVRGMCRECRSIVPARIFFKNNEVWQQSLCPDHAQEPALIASDVKWYLENTLRTLPDQSPLKCSKPPSKGCPYDCGPCDWHASPCQLPVFSITNACNLNCPICFTYNRPDAVWNMTVEEMKRSTDWIIESSGSVDLINITGGEPTLHPQLLDILNVARRPEIGRITMNSNGLLLAENKDLCAHLADLGVYVILSFNTLSPETSIQMHGRDIVDIKLKAIDNLTQAGAKITLLNVMQRGVNENAITDILKLMKSNDSILSLTVQTMTYTGQGGGSIIDRRHIPVDEATRIIASQSNGEIRFDDFFSRPSAHPLCYQICYILKSGETFLPFSRFTDNGQLSKMMEASYLLRLDNEEDFFRNVINDLYSQNETKHLKMFRNLIDSLYPQNDGYTQFERQKRAEPFVRTIYVHSHMDETNFDATRVMLCPDLVPSEPGRLIPACTYNLFYRMKDSRFFKGDKP